MKNKGTEYLQELKAKVSALPESTIFADVEGRDEQYIRVSHAEHAARLAYSGVIDERQTTYSKKAVLQFITTPANSALTIKHCIEFAKNRHEATVNLQVLRNNVIAALDALERMDAEKNATLID